MLRSKRASAGNDGLGRAESRPSRIGPISLGMKQMGARSAGNPHAACDVAGAGNAAWSRWCDTRRRKSEPTGNTNFDLNRRASPRPYLREAGGEIPSAYSPVRADVFGEDRPSPYRLPAVKEKHSARGRENPRADRAIVHMARDHDAGGQGEPHAARMGELLLGRRFQQGVSGARRLRGGAGAPVVALQAQRQAMQGRELSTLAPLRALRARTSESAWARRAVDEGVRSCPRAGCRKSACPVR